MSTLANLRGAKSLDDVAHLLGFMPSGLSFVLYKIPNAKKYTSFEIPKRGGGKRLINAPEPRLALLQRRLANRLYECLDELKVGSPPPRRSLAHGFERKSLHHHQCQSTQATPLRSEPRFGRFLSLYQLRTRPRLLY